MSRAIDDIDSYLDLIGRDRCIALQATTTGFLLDPYRQWIMPAEEIAGLHAASEAT